MSEGHRDEFVAVVDYLNECASARGEQGIPVFLASVILQNIGDSPVAVRFEAVAQPNEWEFAARQAQLIALRDTDEFFSLIDEDRLGATEDSTLPTTTSTRLVEHPAFGLPLGWLPFHPAS